MAKGTRQPRSKRYSYTPIKNNFGETNPRCNGCGADVPLRLWWTHNCEDYRKACKEKSEGLKK